MTGRLQASPVTASRGVVTAQTVRVLSAENMGIRTFRCVLACLPQQCVLTVLGNRTGRALLQARAVLPLFAGLAGILVFANRIHGKVEIRMPMQATLGRDGCLALRIIAGILISALLRVLFRKKGCPRICALCPGDTLELQRAVNTMALSHVPPVHVEGASQGGPLTSSCASNPQVRTHQNDSKQE